MTTVERTAPDILAWSRELVGPNLCAIVDTLPEPVRSVARYHFGWYDERGRPAETAGGKAVRPALVLLAAEVTGGAGTVGGAVPAAVAVELVHNFSLLHDDVLDRDDTRRHRPTAWRVFGVNPAILAGDVLLALSFTAIAGTSAPVAAIASAWLAAAVEELVAGQAMDLAFEHRTDVHLAECVAMSEAKTGALMAVACALGALCGGARPAEVDRFREFGRRLGLAFQLADDLLGIWGDPARTGKAVHSDLRNRKKSLPVVAALTSNRPDAAELAALYHRPQPLSDKEITRAAALVESSGARAWAHREAGTHLAQALTRLPPAGTAGRAAAELETLARLLAERDH